MKLTYDETKRFNELINKSETIMKNLGFKLPDKIQYKLNNRFKSALGRCTRYSNNDVKIEFATYYIKYNLLRNDDMKIMETILHELAHTLPDSFSHNKTWKENVDKINKKHGFNITRTTSMSDNCRRLKYYGRCVVKIQCENGCFEEVKPITSRYVQQLYRYSCKHCGGDIITLDNIFTIDYKGECVSCNITE